MFDLGDWTATARLQADLAFFNPTNVIFIPSWPGSRRGSSDVTPVTCTGYHKITPLKSLQRHSLFWLSMSWLKAPNSNFKFQAPHPGFLYEVDTFLIWLIKSIPAKKQHILEDFIWWYRSNLLYNEPECFNLLSTLLLFLFLNKPAEVSRKILLLLRKNNKNTHNKWRQSDLF